MKESPRLTAIDRGLYRLERRIAGVLMLVMGVVVFLDVVHRVFSRSPGRISVMLSNLSGGNPEQLDELVSPAIILILIFGAVLLAIRARGSAKDGPGISLPKAAAIALGVTAALAIGVKLFIVLRPEGVVWAPYFSLCLLLWVGLIGASMATHQSRHLSLEVGEKLWPEGMRPFVKTLARVCAGSFSLIIALLGAMSSVDHFELWIDTPQAALIPSVDLPKWLVFLVVPYAFGVMGLRFFAHAIGLFSPPPQAEPLPPVPGEDAQS